MKIFLLKIKKLVDKYAIFPSRNKKLKIKKNGSQPSKFYISILYLSFYNN